MSIDYDRGVIKRNSTKLGVAVYMYVDDPGVFLNAFGTQVDDSLATDAGFDVAAFAKVKLKKDRISSAMAEIEAEMASQGPARNVKFERDGFQVIDIGLERYNVEDPDGTVLNSNPLSAPQAKLLLEKLVPKGKTSEPVPQNDPAVAAQA
jgi:hypothetical protein